MNIAVVDAGANLVAHVRMDKAWIGSIDIVINKAFTARAFDIDTKTLATMSQPDDEFFGIQARRRTRGDGGKRDSSGCATAIGETTLTDLTDKNGPNLNSR